MAVDPEAFDQPVVDYDFSKATTPAALIQQMASAGGFTATKFAEARSILAQMKTDIEQVDADPSKVTNWLSFPLVFAPQEHAVSLLKPSSGRCSMSFQRRAAPSTMTSPAPTNTTTTVHLTSMTLNWASMH